jgi:hypothetical protein
VAEPLRVVELGFCHCGCGERTTIAPHTDRHKGWVGGQPKRYLPGHVNRKHGPLYVLDEAGCWVWQRSTDGTGYGVMTRGRSRMPAHRFFYEERFGPIPEGLQLDHLCRNRACVNPDHLEPVTQAENIRRGLRTKLSRDQVGQARALVASGTPHRVVAERFGVAKSTVTHIVNGRTWRDAA